MKTQRGDTKFDGTPGMVMRDMGHRIPKGRVELRETREKAPEKHQREHQPFKGFSTI